MPLTVSLSGGTPGQSVLFRSGRRGRRYDFRVGPRPRSYLELCLGVPLLNSYSLMGMGLWPMTQCEEIRLWREGSQFATRRRPAASNSG